MEENKTEGQMLQDQLVYSRKCAWEKADVLEKEKAFALCEKYKAFLDRAKTEREFVAHAVELLHQHGFKSLDDTIKESGRLTAGQKVYKIVKNKSLVVAVIGTAPLSLGANMVGAHIDSPRIDLKQNPVYEDTGLVLLKTHYYGGIKKYQWVTIPLAMHGVVIKENGELLQICIGENDHDPVFTITDLLPHLAVEQMQKKATEVIAGEDLNLLFGSIPMQDEKVKHKVTLNILKLLHEKYGLIEEDFISAELELVPAFKARDIGLDRGMVGAYGQDDRVCAYTAFKAILDIENPDRTAVCLLTDKEEVGSMGNTGAKSRLFEGFMAQLCAATEKQYDELLLQKCFEASKMLSSDVSAAVDPNFEGVHDKRNASFAGKGIVIQKYTGARGKVDASDASAEFVGEIRRLFNAHQIIWQTGELGKVDKGGGGTIAQYIANLGIDTIDCGVAIFSMHSPFEVASKIDIYTMYKASRVFYEASFKS